MNLHFTEMTALLMKNASILCFNKIHTKQEKTASGFCTVCGLVLRFSISAAHRIPFQESKHEELHTLLAGNSFHRSFRY